MPYQRVDPRLRIEKKIELFFENWQLESHQTGAFRASS